MPATPNWQSRAKTYHPQPIARWNRSCSSASSTRRQRVRQSVRREVDMLGRLSWDAIPFNEPLPIISMAVVLIVILAVLGLVTVKGGSPYLWREWLTSVVQKRICVMYMVLGLVMPVRCFFD